MAGSPVASVDLGVLPFDGGGRLLLRRALAALGPGDRLAVHGGDPDLRVHLAAFCRAEGHQVLWSRQAMDGAATDLGASSAFVALVVRRSFGDARASGVARAGRHDPLPSLARSSSARWPTGAWPREAQRWRRVVH